MTSKAIREIAVLRVKNEQVRRFAARWPGLITGLAAK